MGTRRMSWRDCGALLVDARRPWYARMKPEEAGEWSDVAEVLRDISRFDALILGAADDDTSSELARGFPTLARIVLLHVPIRRALRRLERRGLVQPGWRVTRRAGYCEATPLGHRVAQMVAALANFEDSIGVR